MGTGRAHELLTIALLIGGPVAAGCGNDPFDGFAGRSFLLESAEDFIPVPGTTVQLNFGDGSFGLYADCNHQGFGYKICDGRLCTTSASGTGIGCAPPLNEQDDWLSAFVSGMPTLALQGDRLTLEGDGAVLVFLDRKVADPDRPLTGRTWHIDTFIVKDAATNFGLGQLPTMLFSDDGYVEVFTTCSAGLGRYMATDGLLELHDLRYTKEACDLEGSKQAHEHILEVLTDGRVVFEIQSAGLSLMRGTLGLGAWTG